MSAAYEISRDDDNIIIRIPRDVADERVLRRLLDHLELMAIQSRSDLSSQDIAVMSEEATRAAWERVHHLF